MKKHWLFTTLIALALCLICFVLFPTEAKAASTSDLTFTLNEDGKSYSVSDCDKSASGKLKIPATYKGKPVTAIGDYAINSCRSLTSITIPDSVTSIGDYVFCDCSSLKSITFGRGVASFGKSVFNGCSSLEAFLVSKSNLNYSSDSKGVLFNNDQTTLICAPRGISGSYAIPNGVITVDDFAFLGCSNLTNIDIPESVTYIGSAFSGCDNLIYNIYDNAKYLGNTEKPYHLLVELISDDVTSCKIHKDTKLICEGAFSGYTNLTGIWASEKSKYLSSDKYGVLFDKNKTKLISLPAGFTGNYTIPKSVTTICDYACYWCKKLTGVALPKGVKTIGDNAFSFCNFMKSINIPDGVTTIGDYAFYYCEGLTNVTVPNSVTSIGDSAFNHCYGLQNITLPDSVTSFGTGMFGYCAYLQSVTIPDGVTCIGYGTFTDCYELKEVTIPDSVTSIDRRAFYFCPELKTLVIPEGVTSIGNMAFAYSSVMNITLPDSLTSIDSGAFGHSGVSNIVIPEGVTTIDGSTFYNCGNLQSITIPESVTLISGYAFYRCANLKQVFYAGTKQQWSKINIDDGNEDLLAAKLNYKACQGAAKHAYKTTTSKATLSKNGSIVKKCTTCGKVESTKAIKYVKTIKLSKTSFVYNGKVQKPSVTVKDSAGKTLKKGTDYDVTYASGCKKAGTYKITIKFKGNYSGTKTLTFKILPAAKVATQPKTNKVKVGEKIKFTVKATGTGLKYQWQYSTNGKTWKNCSASAAKKASFSFTSKTSHDGNYYRCKVTDSAGNVVYTKAVRAYVLGIEKQPVKKTVTKNKTAKFSVEASGNGLKYQWQYSTDGGKTWKTCSGTAAQKAAFSFKAKISQNGYYFRCKITDSAKNVIYTSKVKLTVKK